MQERSQKQQVLENWPESWIQIVVNMKAAYNSQHIFSTECNAEDLTKTNICTCRQQTMKKIWTRNLRLTLFSILTCQQKSLFTKSQSPRMPIIINSGRPVNCSN